MGRINDLRNFLGLSPTDERQVAYEVVEEEGYPGYRRQLIRYPGSENDSIPAYLLLPDGSGPCAAVVIHHQHNGERHLGKSEQALQWICSCEESGDFARFDPRKWMVECERFYGV